MADKASITVLQAPPGKEAVFQTAHLSKDLKRRSVRGGGVTLAFQISRFLLQFGSTAILARLLTPSDYGLVAMTAVITGFIGLFRDAGLTSATIQRDELTHDQVSVLFWINAILGLVILLVLAALSPLVAAFYRDPRLTGITCVLAVSFVFGGLGVQHRALLTRQMRFLALGIIDVVSMFVGVCIGVAMALNGFGYWSLVGIVVSMSVASTVAVWIALPWRPGRPRRRTGAGSLVRFGGDVLTFGVANYFSRNADNLLIGWCWGAVPLGLYEKAYNLLLMPIGQINQPLAAVAIPALSRTVKEPARFRRYFLGCLQLAASLSVPVIFIIFLFSEAIVRVWLGAQWLDAAKLFRILALAALVGGLSNPMGWLLVSLGHTKKFRNLGLLSAPIIVLAFAFGLSFGAQGVAYAYSGVMLLLNIPAWLWAIRGTPISGWDLVKTLGLPVVAALLAAAAALAVQPLIHQTALVAFLVGAALFSATYGVLLLLVFRQWSFYLDLLRQLRPAGSN